MHESLSKALKNEFYYEAIFIEYAILEGTVGSGAEVCGDSVHR